MSESVGIFDRDEAFWRAISELPDDVKQRPELMEMLQFKTRLRKEGRKMNHKLSLAEFIVVVVILLALAQGAASLYERVLVSVTQVTAERIRHE